NIFPYGYLVRFPYFPAGSLNKLGEFPRLLPAHTALFQGLLIGLKIVFNEVVPHGYPGDLMGPEPCFPDLSFRKAYIFPDKIPDLANDTFFIVIGPLYNCYSVAMVREIFLHPESESRQRCCYSRNGEHKAFERCVSPWFIV